MNTARGPEQSIGRLIAAFRLLCAAVGFIISIADHQFRGFEPEPDDLLLTGYLIFALILFWLALRNWYLSFRLYYPALVIDFAVLLGAPYALHLDGTDAAGASAVLLFFFSTALAVRRDLESYGLLVIGCATTSVLIGTLLIGFSLSNIVHATVYAIFAVLVVHAVVRRLVRDEPGQFLPTGSQEHADGAEPILRQTVQFAEGTGGCLAWADNEGDMPSICLRLDGRGPCSPEPLAAAARLWPVMLFDIDRRRAIGLGDDGRLQTLNASAVEPLVAPAGAGQGVVMALHGATGSGVMAIYGLAQADWGHLWGWAQVARLVAYRLDLAFFIEQRSIADLIRHRTAIAQDLHDSVAQSLSGTSLWLKALAADPETSPALSRRIAEVQQAVLAEHGDVRRIIDSLREGALDVSSRDLSHSLAELAPRLATQWRMEVDTGDVPNGLILPYATGHEMKQLMREAAANAARHGKASRLAVSADLAEDMLVLRFKDNGIGFGQGGNADWPRSLDRRASRLGGSLEACHSADGNLVAIRLPWGDVR